MDKPERDPNVRDLDDAVIGWRNWQLTRDRPELYSLDGKTAWTPRRMATATCPYSCSPIVVPGRTCSCGVYAAKDLDELLHQEHPCALSTDCVVITGLVAGWGRVVEGSLGWRTSRAYPVHLWLPYDAAWQLKPLKDAYGCKVTLGAPQEVAA